VEEKKGERGKAAHSGGPGLKKKIDLGSKAFKRGRKGKNDPPQKSG